jgi:5-methylthioadenosine/S-adenosylhomocysteine deaminase
VGSGFSKEDAVRTLIRNGYIITMDASANVYERGSVLLQDQHIVWAGEGDVPMGHAEPRPDRTIDAQRRIVIPGLINCHLHSTADYWKGAMDNLSLEPFLLYAHPYAASLRLSEEQMYLRHMTSAIEMLESGTTSTLDDTVHMPSPVDPRPEVALAAYRESVEAALRCYGDLGMRAWVTCNVLDTVMYDTIPWLAELLPADLKAEFDERPFPNTHEIVSFLDDVIGTLGGSRGDRVRLAIAPNGSTRCSDELLTSTWTLANKYDVPMVSHIQESKAEFVMDEWNYGSTAIAHLRDLGVLDHRFGLVHAVWLTDEDVEIAAESGCSVITNPVSNLKLGNGIAPVLQLLEAGAHVSLGTDGPTANDSANLFEAMKALATVQRAWVPDFHRWPTATDVLRIATAGGAYTVGMPEELGSIQVGKRADLTLIDKDSIAYVPFHRPIHQVVFSDTGGSVDMVIVDGRIVVEDGRVTGIPRDEILRAFHEAYRDISPEVEKAVARSARYQPYMEEAYRRATEVETAANPVLWSGSRALTRRERLQ